MNPNKFIGMYGNHRFSFKSEEECNKTQFGEWKPFKSWESGIHIQPTWRSNLTWTAKHADLLTDWKLDTLNYVDLYASLLDSASYLASVEARSSALCDFAISNTITSSVVCDCLGDSGSCFTDQLIPTSVARACSGSGTYPYIGNTDPYIESSAQTSTATVQFYSDSAAADQCAIVTLSDVSAELLKDDSVSLSSAFAKFKKTISYAVKNSHGAIVGSLMGDGIEVTFDNSVSYATFCFNLRKAVVDAADTSLYPIVDIGYTDQSLEKVQPLGVEVKQVL